MGVQVTQEGSTYARDAAARSLGCAAASGAACAMSSLEKMVDDSNRNVREAAAVSLAFVITAGVHLGRCSVLECKLAQDADDEVRQVVAVSCQHSRTLSVANN